MAIFRDRETYICFLTYIMTQGKSYRLHHKTYFSEAVYYDYAFTLAWKLIFLISL